MIPKLHYISQGNSPKTHLDNIQNACASGAELVVLDIQNSSEKKFLKIATKAREITAHFQTRLIINAHIKLAKDLKVDAPCQYNYDLANVLPLQQTPILFWLAR